MRFRTNHIICIFIILCQNIYAEYIPGGFTEQIMLGRRPNARMESMGKTAVASNGYLYAGVVNPACIGAIDNLRISYSIDPKNYYLAKNEDWFSQYFGIGFKYKKFALTYDYYQQSLGNSSVYKNGKEIKTNTNINLYSINSAYEIVDDFYIGSAIRIPRWDLRPFVDWAGYLFDLGITKNLEIINNKKFNNNINIGLSFANIFNQKIVTKSRENAPQIIRLGFSNHLNIKDIFIDYFITNFEFGHIINSAYKDEKNRLNLGFEISLWKLLLLRSGYFYYELEHFGNNSKNHFSDFTYGIGIKIPTKKFLPQKLYPLNLTFDFLMMEQPTYVTDYDSWDNFYNIGFTLDWKFARKKLKYSG